MSNWRASIPSKYLKAADLSVPTLLTISSFSVEKIGDDERPCIGFHETDKGLVLNIVNGDTIEKICGDVETDNWIGKKIVLYATETDYAGKRVACIRVRAPKVQTTMRLPPPIEEEIPLPSEDGLPF
jgi:hypothetical protein